MGTDAGGVGVAVAGGRTVGPMTVGLHGVAEGPQMLMSAVGGGWLGTVVGGSGVGIRPAWAVRRRAVPVAMAKASTRASAVATADMAAADVAASDVAAKLVAVSATGPGLLGRSQAAQNRTRAMTARKVRAGIVIFCIWVKRRRPTRSCGWLVRAGLHAAQRLMPRCRVALV